MKIGLCLAGISYAKPYCEGIHNTRNFMHCYPCYNNLINQLHKLNHEVQTYACTYDNDRVDKLKQTYNIKKITVLPELKYIVNNYYPDNKPMVRTYLRALQELRGEDLDFVIISRFDLYLKTDITKNIDYSKFNFLFKLQGLWEDVPDYRNYATDKDWHFTADSLHAFPYHMLETVINSIEQLLEDSKGGTRTYTRTVPDTLHNLYEFICNNIGEQRIHLIHSTCYHMTGSDVTRLLRFNNPPLEKDQIENFDNDTLPEKYYT